MSYPLHNFTEIVLDKSGGNHKLAQDQFLPTGEYPIIDQGKNFIAGYTDDEYHLMQSTNLPVVIFGDHTKAIKYVDFPFAMGADGIKVLKPQTDCDTKYLFHYLRYAKIPDAGYSRHFKFLKELKIPLPPLEEQRRIAEILDKADSLIQKRKASIAKLDELLQATFIDMFGDPITNPKNLPVYLFQDIITFTGGSQPPKTTFSDTPKDGYIRLIQIRDFRTNKYPTYIPIDLARRTFTENDIMIGRYGPPVFQILKGLSGAYNVALMKAEPKKHIINEFLFYLLSTNSIQSLVIFNSQRSAGQTGVNLEFLNSLSVGIPDINSQEKWAVFATAVEEQKQKLKEQLEAQETLFKSLQQQAFSGQL